MRYVTMYLSVLIKLGVVSRDLASLHWVVISLYLTFNTRYLISGIAFINILMEKKSPEKNIFENDFKHQLYLWQTLRHYGYPCRVGHLI